jgi:hypothetical protein
MITIPHTFSDRLTLLLDMSRTPITSRTSNQKSRSSKTSGLMTRRCVADRFSMRISRSNLILSSVRQGVRARTETMERALSTRPLRSVRSAREMNCREIICICWNFEHGFVYLGKLLAPSARRYSNIVFEAEEPHTLK